MPELGAAADCLEDKDNLERIRHELEAQKCTPNDNVTLLIDGQFPVESDRWHSWWEQLREAVGAQRASATKAKSQDHKMRCFATGHLISPARTHPKIQGLADVGGSSAGSPFASFNKPAFCSYGLIQSANAAVSEEAAAAYRAGLNHLISNNSETLAGAKMIYWYKERVPDVDDPMAWLMGDIMDSKTEKLSAEELARDLLESISSGERSLLGQNHYYAVSLSGAKGRVMVRDWIEGQFEDLVRNIDAWFDDLAIVSPNGNDLLPGPRFRNVVAATHREIKDCPAPLVSELWRSAVRNELIPLPAVTNTLRLWKSCIIKGDASKRYAMSLLKAHHVRWQRSRGGTNVEPDLRTHLNESHPSVAYHCGRLMAVLAAVQQAALGDVGAGVVQRYYAAASSTPALVLGRLTRTSQHHLGKLSKGLAFWYDNRLAEIWNAIGDSLPTTLTPEEQSLFALGYYQQLADLRKKRNIEVEEAKDNA